MYLNGFIYTLNKELKHLIGAFIIVLSIGFFTGILFVNNTASSNPQTIEEHYLGNENNDDAKIMKFKKSKHEMYILIHNHILSMSIIFFLLGIILSITQLNTSFKLFLMIEPFISVVLTFGGLYLMWQGHLWMTYIVMVSGFAMVIVFTLSILIILAQLFGYKKSNNTKL